MFSGVSRALIFNPALEYRGKKNMIRSLLLNISPFLIKVQIYEDRHLKSVWWCDRKNTRRRVKITPVPPATDCVTWGKSLAFPFSPLSAFRVMQTPACLQITAFPADESAGSWELVRPGCLLAFVSSASGNVLGTEKVNWCFLKFTEVNTHPRGFHAKG